MSCLAVADEIWCVRAFRQVVVLGTLFGMKFATSRVDSVFEPVPLKLRRGFGMSQRSRPGFTGLPAGRKLCHLKGRIQRYQLESWIGLLWLGP